MSNNNTPERKEVIISQTDSDVNSKSSVRVAFYVRVSIDNDEQMNSFENQKAAVKVIMTQHPEFVLVKIYSDSVHFALKTNAMMMLQIV